MTTSFIFSVSFIGREVKQTLQIIMYQITRDSIHTCNEGMMGCIYMRVSNYPKQERGNKSFLPPPHSFYLIIKITELFNFLLKVITCFYQQD
jgi:hypothetical protein